MPYFKAPRPVLIYALATMGYHFSDALLALTRERESDFWEMNLHHVATCSLYFCMITGNYLGIGCLIAYLHDLADITVQMCKLLASSNYGNLAFAYYFVFISAWFWTRLYVFPQILYYIWTNDFNDSVVLFIRINALMLSVL